LPQGRSSEIEHAQQTLTSTVAGVREDRREGDAGAGDSSSTNAAPPSGLPPAATAFSETTGPSHSNAAEPATEVDPAEADVAGSTIPHGETDGRIGPSSQLQSPPDQTAAQKPLEWTLTHSYFANMGGIRILSPNREMTLTLNSTQLALVLKDEIMSKPPDIKLKAIYDRVKVDAFTKALAITQVLWILIAVSVRGARSLAVSQLEILTLAFSFCCVLTYLFCWHKPQGVSLPIIIEEPLPITSLLRVWQAEAQRVWKDITSFGRFEHNITGFEGEHVRRVRNDNFELSAGLTQPAIIMLAIATVSCPNIPSPLPDALLDLKGQ
jgi:hypothetical protein